MSKLKLKGKSNLLKKSASSINRRELNLALSESTNCGSGINSLKGFVSLPSFDSVTGDKEGFHGFYFVDGELVTDTVPNIKEDIKSFCNGGGQEPQALRLTFNSIENANLLVGDASNVTDWNTFFDLPTYGNPFTGVTVTGSTVQLFGGSDITIKDYTFNYNNNILKVIDSVGCVVSIYTDSFSYSENITEVSFPECLDITGGPYDDAGAFYGLFSLTSMYFPKLIAIDNQCFSSCTSLTTVDLPSLTSAGSYSFYDCDSLTTVDLPSLTTAGIGCFGSCSSLTTVDFSGLTTAGDGCFYNCNSLTTVDLPSLTTAGSGCFEECTSLTTVDLPSLTIAGVGCFDNSTSLTTVDLPSLTTAADYCFSNCTSLTTINIPSCTNLGGSVGNNGVFGNIVGNTINLTVPTALMTADSGNPDGDIAYLQANNTVTVVTV